MQGEQVEICSTRICVGWGWGEQGPHTVTPGFFLPSSPRQPSWRAARAPGSAYPLVVSTRESLSQDRQSFWA